MRAHVDGQDLVCREPGFGAYQLRLAQGVEIPHAHGFCLSIDELEAM